MLQRWSIPNFTVDTDTELIQATSGMETVIFSLFLCNNESSNETKFTIKHTDIDGSTVIFNWNITKGANETPTAIEVPIVLLPGDKIIAQSTQENASILASGEEK